MSEGTIQNVILGLIMLALILGYFYYNIKALEWKEVEAKEKSIKEFFEWFNSKPVLGVEANPGLAFGEVCNRKGCKAILQEAESDGCCSCHIHPPCSYCTTNRAYCPACGWNAQGEKQWKPSINMKYRCKENLPFKCRLPKHSSVCNSTRKRGCLAFGW